MRKSQKSQTNAPSAFVPLAGALISVLQRNGTSQLLSEFMRWQSNFDRVKLCCLFAAFQLLAPLTGKADWIVVQQVQNTGPCMHETNQITIKIKGTRVRVDTDRLTSVIEDGKTGDQVFLLHAEKSYILKTAAQRKEDLDFRTRLASRSTPASNTVPSLLATGRRDKINGYESQEYVWNAGLIRGSYWVAGTFPNGPALHEALIKAFEKTRQLVLHPLPDERLLPGLPMRFEQTFALDGLSAGRATESTTTVTLLSASEQDVASAEFSIPTDYMQRGVAVQTNTTPVSTRQN